MSIETSICTLNKKVDDLVEIRMIEEYKVHIADILEIQKGFKQLTLEGKKYPVLVVPGRYGGLADETKGMDMLEVYHERVHKLALVTPKLRQKLLAKFYFNYISKPNYDYQLFSNEQSALKWLMN
ncbi:MAG: STAS/SEC14 domain-containing protein [Bacteroidetes bacterium]|nr:STAS/SEC14 domain-containing protein [Bacteroidota bacterium]